MVMPMKMFLWMLLLFSSYFPFGEAAGKIQLKLEETELPRVFIIRVPKKYVEKNGEWWRSYHGHFEGELVFTCDPELKELRMDRDQIILRPFGPLGKKGVPFTSIPGYMYEENGFAVYRFLAPDTPGLEGDKFIDNLIGRNCFSRIKSKAFAANLKISAAAKYLAQPETRVFSRQVTFTRLLPKPFQEKTTWADATLRKSMINDQYDYSMFTVTYANLHFDYAVTCKTTKFVGLIYETSPQDDKILKIKAIITQVEITPPNIYDIRKNGTPRKKLWESENLSRILHGEQTTQVKAQMLFVKSYRDIPYYYPDGRGWSIDYATKGFNVAITLCSCSEDDVTKQICSDYVHLPVRIAGEGII